MRDEGSITGQERLNLTSVNSPGLEAIVLTTITKEVWLRERQQQLARQLIANADVRRRWIEADPIEVSTCTWKSTSPQFSDNGSHSKLRFKALLAEGATTAVRNALAHMVRCSGIQRTARQ